LIFLVRGWSGRFAAEVILLNELGFLIDRQTVVLGHGLGAGWHWDWWSGGLLGRILRGILEWRDRDGSETLCEIFLIGESVEAHRLLGEAVAML
jgi:hypothetical protein